MPVPAASSFRHRLIATLAAMQLGASLAAAPLAFDLPPQPASDALLAFSRQAKIEVLFSFDQLRHVPAPAVQGNYEPEDALNRLLHDTGYGARRNWRGKFVVARLTAPTGGLAGRLLLPTGEPAVGIPVAIDGTRQRGTTDPAGNFIFTRAPVGEFRVLAGGHGFRPVERLGVRIEEDRTTRLDPIRLDAATGVTELEPYLVNEQKDRLLIGEGVGAAPRRAGGNLDLPRTEDNALPFTTFSREQIARSGVVQLNEFLQREVLDGNSSMPPEQDSSRPAFESGSSNLSLRGYGTDETVILVNGRRLPETFTGNTGALGAPDVNLVPLSLVQQIEVLPVSASALYSGNAVGGVINIVLRPEADGTEIRTTYTNALDGFDAPQSSVSLQHSRHLLNGRLRVQFNATFTETTPAVESELGYQNARLAMIGPGEFARATPNVQSAAGASLFGTGSPAFTSVAPGSDGSGGLAAFGQRQGVRSNELFDTPGGLAASFNSRDFPYGREQRRAAYYGSFVYDLFPWLQLGLDANYARTIVHRGYDVFPGNLTLAATSPLNPFGQDIQIALNETTARLGQDYNEAQLDAYSLVGGALVKLPNDWRVTFDGQYSRSLARYRGILRADANRWQQIVDEGLYQPLRDTQVFGPPAAFYDRVLVYYGGPGRFLKLGDYETFDGAVRVTNEALPLPTGTGTLNLGMDYRQTQLAPYTEEPRFADGTPAAEIIHWTGRTLERMSVFGELQAPLVPARWLPRWIRSIETDSAVRYIVSTQSNETSLAPTAGLKIDFPNGLAVRGSFTTSNRFPTPQMSRPLANGAGEGSGSELTLVSDPRRNGERYEVESKFVVNPNIRPEAAATQTAGLIFHRGAQHRFRASLDFADTTKTNEFVTLDAAGVLNLESIFPDRVLRNTPTPSGVPRITTVLVGTVNVARRHSQNWTAACDYTWKNILGGALEVRGRWTWFQRYDRQLLPNDPVIDELSHPDGTAAALLRHRLSFGASWSGPAWGVGLDGHYLSERILPESEWLSQGGDRIPAYWQFDAYVQGDLMRLAAKRTRKYGLNAQLRINNLSGFGFPKYANNASGAGVQPYGDWRGPTYSISLTATF